MPEDYQPYPPELIRSMSPEQMADFSKWRLDIDDLLEYLEHDLKGDKLDKEGNWIKDEDTNPDMNNQGVKAIISTIRVFCNKYTTLSNLTNDEIMAICRYLHIDLAEMLFFSYDVFDINEDILSMLVNKIMSFVFMSLKKAQGEGERISLSKQETTIRHIEQEKPKGFSLNPFGRGKEEERR